ncbi:MAG: adenosine deaminase, partial [Acidimicrobiaceae bacterium]|nr:adenosine deaminase [Acidimicrobiaceae bacterium]
NAYVTDGTKAAAIKSMLDQGLRVTLNSDDPAYFPGYVVDNFLRVHDEVGLSADEVVRLVRNSFEISWLDDDSRAEYLRRVDASVAGA